jgi:hypothetical protein
MEVKQLQYNFPELNTNFYEVIILLNFLSFTLWISFQNYENHSETNSQIQF